MLHISFRMIFEQMKSMYPKVFGKQVIGFDSEKNAYTITPLFQENQAQPGKKFEVSQLQLYGRFRDIVRFTKVKVEKNCSCLCGSAFVTGWHFAKLYGYVQLAYKVL